MRSILKKILFAAMVIAFTGIVKAQNNTKGRDYVIKSAGDTVFCKISTSFFGGYNYKSSLTGNESVRINSGEIKECYISKKNKLYQSVIISGEKQSELLDVIERGKINIYEKKTTTYSAFGNGASTTVTMWYVSKGSNIVEELKCNSLLGSKQQRVANFGEMLKDNKEVYDKFIEKDKKFSFTQIKNLVHLYNTGEWLEKVESTDYY